METRACTRVALTFPMADAMLFFAPCCIPWVRASNILGPGIMEAIKTVAVKINMNCIDMAAFSYRLWMNHQSVTKSISDKISTNFFYLVRIQTQTSPCF